jgi:hypothetical protein
MSADTEESSCPEESAIMTSPSPQVCDASVVVVTVDVTVVVDVVVWQQSNRKSKPHPSA